MDNSTLYNGKIFVGKQTTSSDKTSGRTIETYCIFQPKNQDKPSHFYGIPIKAHEDYPWMVGLKGLAATVVQNYGPDYNNIITFESPEDQRVGSDKSGWCTRTYKQLSPNELEYFHNAAEEWMQENRILRIKR